MLIFRTVVFMIIISGITAFALSVRDYAEIEKFITGKVRVLLRGAACAKVSSTMLGDHGPANNSQHTNNNSSIAQGSGGHIKYRALSNKSVLEKVGLAPVHIEVAAQRLKSMQRIAKCPDHHKKFLTAMFEPMPFEITVGQMLGMEAGGYNHPWFEQMCNDLKLLESFDDHKWILEALGDTPQQLFRSPELAEAFCNVDLRVVRHLSFSATVPPTWIL